MGCAPPQQVAACARFRDRTNVPVDQRCTRAALRALARRIEHLDAEVDDHDRALKTLLDQAAPQLLTERGIGYVTAAEFYITWSHPGRCRSEAAFARLGGTSPVAATSGLNQTRHRLNRGGDRQLNRALYLVAITKQRCDPATKTYTARRTAEGKTDRETTRCIKRFIARPRLATPRAPTIHHLTDIEASLNRVPAGGTGHPPSAYSDAVLGCCSRAAQR